MLTTLTPMSRAWRSSSLAICSALPRSCRSARTRAGPIPSTVRTRSSVAENTADTDPIADTSRPMFTGPSPGIIVRVSQSMISPSSGSPCAAADVGATRCASPDPTPVLPLMLDMPPA
jgi:hypothetical protein